MGAEIVVLPASASYDEVMAHIPHGVLLSNGLGDPAATGKYAIRPSRALVELKGAAVWHPPGPSDAGAGAGGNDAEDGQGHHGADDPVKDLETARSRSFR